MVTIAVISFSTALGASGLLIWLGSRFNVGIDGRSGVQKFHVGFVPRTGGAAIFVAFTVGVFSYIYLKNISLAQGEYLKFIIVSALPVFLGGMAEDLTCDTSVLSRFLLAVSSAMMAYFILDASIIGTSVPWMDYLLQFRYVSFPLSVLAISAVCNGCNMIDGYHGNAVGWFVLTSILVYLAAIGSDDPLLAAVAMVSAGAGFGFLCLNFPFGKIFLGDSGSYTVGFFASVLIIVLINRNDDISPWFAFLLVAYPFTELCFSIARRFFKGRAPTMPDNNHLHTLLYRFLLNKKLRPAKANPLTSCILLSGTIVFSGVGFANRHHSWILFVTLLSYVLAYLIAYRYLLQKTRSSCA